jgi:ATPase subunit of ABC transporter with duplicated ATPase domains
MISVSNLSRSFGDRTLFEDAAFQLNPGERYGIVGANGCGKTTLLSILSGDLDASTGTVSIPKSARLGVLRQDQFLYENEQVLEVALMGHPELWKAMVEKEELLANAHIHFDADRYTVLEETVQRLDGYTAEARAATILEGLGLPASVHRQPLSTLSGGFKLRVLLAQVLAGSPDVLLLDEPTNHLDILSIRWLEKFLHDFEGPVAVISHDHRFLDNVSSYILDVDYQTVTLYRGNYSEFQVQKVEDRERREKEIEGQKKSIAHQQKFVDKFKAKASKARQAQSKLKMIERQIDQIEELPGSSRRYPKFRFQQRRQSGKEVLKVVGIRKSFGEKEVIPGVDLRVERGDRLVIMGPNGIGKSTLLKIVMDQLKADAGQSEWGYEAHVGYFAQDHHEQLEGIDQTVEQWLWNYCPGKDRGFVRGHLGMMLFSGDDGEKKLAALSGGEAARLVFSRLALEQPNVLVLDEPTNHLDLESIEALVAGLQSYEGTLILVSHDRWFVGQLATRVLEISPNGIRDYLGTYEEYVHACGDDHLDADTVVLKARKQDQEAKTVRRAAAAV